ncbi:MAG: hypothetical protein ABI142_04280 [Bryocella sp.]
MKFVSHRSYAGADSGMLECCTPKHRHKNEDEMILAIESIGERRNRTCIQE